MNPTLKFLADYFSGETPEEPKELESKKDLKKEFEEQFKTDLDAGILDPLPAFQLLYHRLQEIANVAKEVFYGPAVEQLKKELPEGKNTTSINGVKVTLSTSEKWDVIKSPKILQYEKEIAELEQKHKSVISKYERYKQDVKSIENHIKEEESRLIEQGMGKKTGVSEVIKLSY